jgi:hypothetical protein
MLKTWDSVYFLIRTDSDSFAENATYYQIAEDLLNTHEFDSEIERKVWALHTEGLSVRDIELKLIETKAYAWEAFAQGKNLKDKAKINKDLINAIIQRLQKFIGRR